MMHQICQMEFIEKNVKLNELRTHILMSTKAEKKTMLFEMNSKTLLSATILLLEMCQTLGFPKFQNNIGMQLFF